MASNTSNKVVPLKTNFLNSPNANESFTGNPTVPLKEVYPEKFVHAYNPDYGIDENDPFAEIVATHPGTAQLINFPYGLVADINSNVFTWGIYVSENISRVYRALESLKNAMDTNNFRSNANNESLKYNFDVIAAEFQDITAQSLEGDVFRNRVSINRNVDVDPSIRLRLPKSMAFEKVNDIEFVLRSITSEVVNPDGSFLLDGIIRDRNIPINAISLSKLKFPVAYMNTSIPELFMKSVDFAGTYVPHKAEKNTGLDYLTRNDQVIEAAAPRLRKIHAVKSTSLDYSEYFDGLFTGDVRLDLRQPLNIDAPINCNTLDIIGNGYSVSTNANDVTCGSQLKVSSIFVADDIKIISPKTCISDANTQMVDIAATSEVTLKDIIAAGVVIHIAADSSPHIHIEDVESATGITVRFTLSTAGSMLNNMYLTTIGKYGIIKFEFINPDGTTHLEGDIDDPFFAQKLNTNIKI